MKTVASRSIRVGLLLACAVLFARPAAAQMDTRCLGACGWDCCSCQYPDETTGDPYCSSEGYRSQGHYHWPRCWASACCIAHDSCGIGPECDAIAVADGCGSCYACGSPGCDSQGWWQDYQGENYTVTWADTGCCQWTDCDGTCDGNDWSCLCDCGDCVNGCSPCPDYCNGQCGGDALCAFPPA